jgi:hypothetical protein
MPSSSFTNPLPGVPNVESPFFEAIFADADPVLRDLALQLSVNGFAVMDFPDANFEAKAEAIKTNLNTHFSAQDWERFRQGKGSGLRVQDAWEFDENVKSIACNPTMLNLLSQLYGKPVCPFQTLNFPVGTEQHFHTDALHFSSMPERFMCGVWVALEDITLENGPLLYYPGSHRWPIYTNEHIGRCVTTMAQKPTQALYEEMWRALVAAQQLQPQRFLAKKGQALIWATNLMHGGSPQLDKNKTRWSQVTHYFFENCAYYTPMMSDPFFGQIDFRKLVNIQTGEPMPHQYAGQTIPTSFIDATDPVQRGWDTEFDPALYLAANPDVAADGVNPFEHYMRYGQREKRRLRP